MNNNPSNNATRRPEARNFSGRQAYENEQAELTRLAGLRSLWDESERVLCLLRTQGAVVPPPASDEQIKQWANRGGLKPLPRISFPAPSANDFFGHCFPQFVCDYGIPVFQAVQFDRDNFKHTTPTALNTDFFAALLGGDARMGHKVVFYLPEQQWYFYDCLLDCFVPTTEEKLCLVLSQYLIACGENVSRFTAVTPLFIDLREDEKLMPIVKKARSLLAADRTFFEAPNGHKRRCGSRVLDPAMEPSHKLFIKEVLAAEPERILTVGSCFENYSRYCEKQGFAATERRLFTGLAKDGIREQFGLGFRKDLKDNGRWQKGWKGLIAHLPEAPALDLSKN